MPILDIVKPARPLTDDQIIALLQADVLAARAAGYTIDFGTVGLKMYEENGEEFTFWQPHWVGCKMCAIGARLMGHYVQDNQTADFAATVGRSFDWGCGFMQGSDSNGPSQIPRGHTHEFNAGWHLGDRLCRWWARAQFEEHPMQVSV